MTTAGTSTSPNKGKPPWILIVAGAVVLFAASVGLHSLKHAKSAPEPNAPVTATIMFENELEHHKCTPDLNLRLAGKTYNLATSPYAASGVPEGPQEYSIDGLVSCPGRPPSKASGSGAVDVREGAVFYITWQTKSDGTEIVDVIRAVDYPAGESNSTAAPPQQTGSTHRPKPSPERPGQEGATPGKSSPPPQRF